MSHKQTWTHYTRGNPYITLPFNCTGPFREWIRGGLWGSKQSLSWDGNGPSCLAKKKQNKKKNVPFQLCKGMKSLLCLLVRTPVAPAWASGGTVNKQTREFTHTLTHTLNRIGDFVREVTNGHILRIPTNIEYESWNNTQLYLYFFHHYFLFCVLFQHYLFFCPSFFWEQNGNTDNAVYPPHIRSWKQHCWAHRRV